MPPSFSFPIDLSPYLNRSRYPMGLRGSRDNGTDASHTLSWDVWAKIVLSTKALYSSINLDNGGAWVNSGANLTIKSTNDNRSVDKRQDNCIADAIYSGSIIGRPGTTINDADLHIKSIARLRLVFLQALTSNCPIIVSVAAKRLSMVQFVDPITKVVTCIAKGQLEERQREERQELQGKLALRRLEFEEGQQRREIELLFQATQPANALQVQDPVLQEEHMRREPERENKSFRQALWLEEEGCLWQMAELEKKHLFEMHQLAFEQQTLELDRKSRVEEINRLELQKAQLAPGKLVYQSCGSANGREVFRGPRGGLWFWTGPMSKRYLTAAERGRVVTISSQG